MTRITAAMAALGRLYDALPASRAVRFAVVAVVLFAAFPALVLASYVAAAAGVVWLAVRVTTAVMVLYRNQRGRQGLAERVAGFEAYFRLLAPGSPGGEQAATRPDLHVVSGDGPDAR